MPKEGRSLCQVAAHLMLLFVGCALDSGLEEENTQNGKHNKEFDGDDNPQGTTPSHLFEAFYVKA